MFAPHEGDEYNAVLSGVLGGHLEVSMLDTQVNLDRRVCNGSVSLWARPGLNKRSVYYITLVSWDDNSWDMLYNFVKRAGLISDMRSAKAASAHLHPFAPTRSPRWAQAGLDSPLSAAGLPLFRDRLINRCWQSAASTKLVPLAMTFGAVGEYPCP